MITSSRLPPVDPARNFQIKATRIKAELDPSEEFFWFYVSIHLEQQVGATISLGDIEIVEYHLLDSSIPTPIARVTTAANGFEYRLWLYGFIRVCADLITKNGDLIAVKATEISWSVTESEMKLNGKSELTW